MGILNLKGNFVLQRYFTAIGVFICMISCSPSIPEGTGGVHDFAVDRYLGKWYEIARFDFKFEKNLNNVTAEYSLNQDGSIKVLNKGFNYVEKQWESAEGKAKFRGDTSIAELKVSFFGPFYSGYNVIALDDDYQYALIAGKNLEYLWLLSRRTSMPDSVKQVYLDKAKEVGYDTSRLIWVEHDQN